MKIFAKASSFYAKLATFLAQIRMHCIIFLNFVVFYAALKSLRGIVNVEFAKSDFISAVLCEKSFPISKVKETNFN